MLVIWNATTAGAMSWVRSTGESKTCRPPESKTEIIPRGWATWPSPGNIV
jgi:hypothetical protein